MIRRWLAAVVLFCAAAPALADTTAVYRSERAGVSFTLEVADNGDMRMTADNQTSYSLRSGGKDYIINTEYAVPVVDHAADLTAAIATLQTPGTMALRRNLESEAPIRALIERGTETVRGRSGRAFWLADNASPTPMMIMSDDPALAALGEAFRWHFALGLQMSKAVMGAENAIGIELQNTMRTGAPVLFAAITELVSVSHAPIDPERFKLPAPPETRDQLRERLAARIKPGP